MSYSAQFFIISITAHVLSLKSDSVITPCIPYKTNETEGNILDLFSN